MITAPTAKAIAMVDKAFFPFSSSPIGSFSVEFYSDELFNTVDCGGSSPAGGSSIGPSTPPSSPSPPCKARPGFIDSCPEQTNINAKKIKISNTFIFIFK